MKLIFKKYISNMEFDSDAFNTGFHEHSKLPSPSITPANQGPNQCECLLDN
jgi:hypothetical protein